MNRKLTLKIISGCLLCSTIFYTVPVFAYTKDETVYSKLDSTGNSYKTLVSTHLKNTDEQDILDDLSDLINIENTNGDEEFSQDGNSLIWKANKKDIYYQGDSQKDLPIECNITYKLDDKEMQPEEILGKSGNIKIIINYINKDEHIVNIDGVQEELYTPFVVVAGTIINGNNVKNVTVSSGKVIDDGSKSIVMGIAFPGLQESLDIKKEKLDIPSSIEISMETSNFEMNNIVTFVTPKLLEDDDLDYFDKLDDLYEKVNTLKSSTNQIQDGSKKLLDGTTQLFDGVNNLKNGTNSAYEGAKSIQGEVSKATKGLSSNTGDTLDAQTLNAIGKQAQTSAILSDSQKSAIGVQAQNSAIQAIQLQKTTIGAQAANVAKQSIESQKNAIGEKAAQSVSSLTLTDSQKQQILSSVENSLKQNTYYQSLDKQQQAIILSFSQNSALSAAESTFKSTAKQVASQTAKDTASTIATQVADATAQSVAEQVAGQVANTTAQSVAQSTATQTAQVTATQTAKQVANQVKTTAQKQVVSQMNTLDQALNQLTNGLSSLNSGTDDLQKGASELKNGAEQLNSGIVTFNRDGISKICNTINVDVKNVADRAKVLTDLSKQYNNFTMLNGNNDGNSKFILIIDALKKQEESDNTKETAILNNKNEN